MTNSRFIFHACVEHPSLVKSLPKEFRQNKSFITNLVKKNGRVIEFISPEFKTRELFIMLFELCPHRRDLDYLLPNWVWDDFELVSFILPNCINRECWKYVPVHFFDDENLIEKVWNAFPERVLEFVPRLNSDINLVSAALDDRFVFNSYSPQEDFDYYEPLKFASPSLQKDIENVSEIFKVDKRKALKLIAACDKIKKLRFVGLEDVVITFQNWNSKEKEIQFFWSK